MELLQRVYPPDHWQLLDTLANTARAPLTGAETDENSITSRIESALRQLTENPDQPGVVEAIRMSADRLWSLWLGDEKPTTLVGDLNSLAHCADTAQLLIRDQLPPSHTSAP